MTSIKYRIGIIFSIKYRISIATLDGAIVEVCDDAGETHTYRIVGADETDAKTSAISMDSPLARSLLAKRVDDEIVVTIGDKTTTMNVVSIRYEELR